MSEQALLELEAAELRAAARVLVRDLHLRVEAGQRWAVIGRNGAGKSTLLRALAGLGGAAGVQPRLDGQALARISPSRLARLRAYMPAVPQDRFGISVLDAVMLGQAQPDPSQARQWLQGVDAGELAARSLLRLSAGERQRVALAQALAQDAALLLLDEPASFQDPRHQAWLARRLREHVQASQRRALVFSAHDLNWVGLLASHVLALLPDGSWRGGAAGEVLVAPVLQAVYDCAWERIERRDASALWVARAD